MKIFLLALTFGLYGSIMAVIDQPISIRAQGSLAPPGPPGPTMRTLTQVEPRTPISSLPYTITTPGAYYLTANLTASSGGNGITIAADNVDLDMMGFTLTGISNSVDAISVLASHINIAIHNGNILGWSGFGVNGTNATSSSLERLRALNNGPQPVSSLPGGGLALGAGSVIRNCQANTNSGNGLAVGDGSVVSDSTTIGNGTYGGGDGIHGGSGVVLNRCASTFNRNWGISVSNDCSITDCSASQNNQFNNSCGGISTGNGAVITTCTANKNSLGFNGFGVLTGSSCTIKECIANNQYRGIQSGSGCDVSDCTVNSNAGQGTGMIIGDGSIVRGCVVENNGYGGILCGNSCLISDNATLGNIYVQIGTGYPDIEVTGLHNVVVRNSVETNWFFGTGYNNPTNNAIGTIETAASLNTDKNPHANFSP